MIAGSYQLASTVDLARIMDQSGHRDPRPWSATSGGRTPSRTTAGAGFCKSQRMRTDQEDVTRAVAENVISILLSKQDGHRFWRMGATSCWQG